MFDENGCSCNYTRTLPNGDSNLLVSHESFLEQMAYRLAASARDKVSTASIPQRLSLEGFRA